MPSNSKVRSWASSYAPTDQLTRIASECGVSADTVELRLPSHKLVELFGPKPKPVYDWNKEGLVHARKGEPIKLRPTAETEAWTASLEALNAFYRAQDICLSLSPEELAQWLNERNADPDRRGAPYRLPEVFQTDIYRVFNNGDENQTLDQGGRLFGSFWMSTPSELRTAITINGQTTIEIDYAECHPRMLYHLAASEGDGALYSLAEIAAFEVEAGVPTDTYRPYLKWLMQVLINCKGRTGSVKRPTRLSVPAGFTTKEMVGFLEARHAPIAHAFRTGAGMWLMRLESDIALKIVSTAMNEGWTVLSVHDSFITTADCKERLETLMIDTYFKQMGREPILKIFIS